MSGGDDMIQLGYCDDCKHCLGMSHGEILCDAFPNGIPNNHLWKSLSELKKCNNGIGFEPKEENNEPAQK